MNTQRYTVNVRVGGIGSPRVAVSQGDIGRRLVFDLFDGAVAFAMTSGTTATIVGRKPSGLGFDETCTHDGGNSVSVQTTEAMTQEAGKIPAELRISDGTKVIGTANFVFYVEPSPHPNGTTDGTLETMDDIQTQIGDLSDLTTSDKSSLVGAINEAAQSGGSEIVIDATLTQSGQAADAKATGDALSALEDAVTEDIGGLKADLGAYVFGDNLVSMPASGKTHNGITFTVDGDAIVANGTATGNAYIDVCKITPATSGSYTLKGSPSGGGHGAYILYIVNTDNYDIGNGATYTLTAGVEYTVRIIVYSGHVASNLTFTPVLIYNETGNVAFNAVKTELSDKVSGVKGNNIFTIPDYEGSPNGMKISIKNNRITLKGTNTTAIRLKLTHGVDVQNTEQNSWANESLSDMFEVGKQYCIAYKVYRGTLSNTIGTPARVSKSPSVSFLSGSVPKNIATAGNMPKYIMLYIPINTTADVTFEPFFMEAYTQNDMFSYDVSEDVKITSKKTPKNQYNYFTVSVNTSNDDSVETLQNVNAVVTFPESYKAQGEKTPLIMYCHGRTDTVSVGDWVENDTKRKTLIESFVSGGYAVFDVDAISHPPGGAVDVGSPAIMQAYIKAWEYIKEHYNVEDKLFIYSLSFGTFVALNMLSWYPTVIKTACLSAIRASHRAVFDRGTPYNAEIAVNFGFNDSTGATYEADKMLGFDPYADISDGKLIKSIPPIKVFTSSGDTLELTEAHTLISAWKAGGNFINYKEVSNLNHSDMCCLADAGLRSEVVAWFNRYK